MLGAIKGEAQSQASLFRLLSRRWRPLATVKPSSLPALFADQEQQRAPTWIGRKRARYVAPPAPPPKAAVKPRSTWSPWQWVK